MILQIDFFIQARATVKIISENFDGYTKVKLTGAKKYLLKNI